MSDAKRQRTINDVFGAVQELEGVYEVEGIIDSKLFLTSMHSRVPRVTKFRVRFVGYGPSHDEWKLEEELEDAQDLLNDYKHKEKIRVLENENLGLYQQLGETLGKLENEKQRFSNLMESHEDVHRRSRGHSNGFNWIRNENLLLREKICEVKYLATSAMVNGGFAEAMISIQEQPEVPVCTAAKMSPTQRAEIFEESFEGDMCACAVCLRSKVTLKDVMEQNKAMRIKLGKQHGRRLEFARRGVPGLSFVARGTREETPLSPP
jgi:hypothetical protein